jgi:putative ABC transport system permease protein
VDEGDPGNAVSASARVRLAAGAGLLLVLATAIFVLEPSAALVACVAVAMACVLAMPLIFVAVIAAAGYIARHSEHLTILPVALMSLRKTTLRSLALVMTGAVALFGSVALSGVRADLLSGLGGFAQAASSAGAIWVLNPRDVTDTTSFLPGKEASRMARVPGVRTVYTLQGGFVNVGERRLAIFARPDSTVRPLLKAEIVAGDLAKAEHELEEGGWIAASQQLAEEHHVGVGGTLDLVASNGAQSLKVAALTTDFGWPGGAVLMNTRDSNRLLATHAPTALVAVLARGSNAAHARNAIAATLGASTGLEVMTANTGLGRFSSLLNEGLIQLQWISVMLVIAAILAMAAALAADIWQQRPWLSGLRLGAVPVHRLRRILLMKSALTLGAGCLAGALGGIYGQVILDAYLKHVTGFPVAVLASAWLPLATFALVIVAALLIAAIPAWFALRAPLTLALERQ